MKAAVRRYAAGAEFCTEEGCFINELSNIADDPSVSIARWQFSGLRLAK
jgi:hypothetical protein